jgi:tyrosine-protein kinase Etk/Wzc
MSSMNFSFLSSRASRRRVAAVTLAAALMSVGYALVATRWYRAQITVVPSKPQRGGGGLSSLLGGELAGLGGGLEAAAGIGADVQRIAAVFQSDTVTDAVIEKFNLKTRYGQKFQEPTRGIVWSLCSTKALPKPNLVQLSCEERDPALVRDLVAYFADHGNEVFRRISVSSASEEVRFLQKRVGELTVQADESSARMRAFQEKHQVVDLDAQTKVVVSAMASLQSQRMAKQLELDYARTFSSGEESSLRQLRSQLRVIDEQLRGMERTPEVSDRGDPASSRTDAGGMFPRALDVPKLRAEFESLYRDRKVAEATLIVALERLENAQANEARDVSTFLVLDPPTLPTRHVRPKRSMIVAVGTLLGLFGALAYEWHRSGGRFTSVVTAILGKGPTR